MPFHNQPDARHATLKRTGDTRDPVVDLRGPTVDRNLDREGTPRCEGVGDRRGDEGPVSKEGDEQSLLFGISIDVEKIRPDKNFTTRVKKPETAGIGYFVENSTMFLESYNSERTSDYNAWSIQSCR